MIFGSPRQALAYLYAHHRGPTAARPKYHDAPPDTGGSHWDGSIVGALLYGPRSTGSCGVPPDSTLDRQLRYWATHSGVRRTKQIAAIERRMRSVLRAHGLIVPVNRSSDIRHWTDPDGVCWARFR